MFSICAIYFGKEGANVRALGVSKGYGVLQEPPAMLTAAECQNLAAEYKSMAQRPDVSKECAVMLTNIARSLSGLATQLDKLAAYMRDHPK